ncbi:MAG: relaxase/mobilization nuclease domain-containing protein [Schwartzia sp.]|nr:relaxase/mobilization nuclease domain-containing protein [Schwartzia sp. (in: firmicutes)]
MAFSIFKIVPHSDADSNKLYERLNYIRNPMATDVCMTCGMFVSCRYPWEEMMLVKQSHLSPHNNTLAGKHFFEYVVSLPCGESCRVQEFLLCVQEINRFMATYSEGHYQTISCVHTNTDNLHAHIIVNNIDWVTGKRFHLQKPYFYEIMENVSDVLQRYGFSVLAATIMDV